MAVVEGKAKVTLDGAEAGQSLERLEAKAAELRREIVKTRKEPLLDQKKIKSLQTQLKSVQSETKQIREQTVSYKKVLDNLSGASLNKLNAAYRKLNREVKTLDRNTPNYKKKAADLAKLKTEISKVKKEMRGAGTSSKGFSLSLKNIGSQLFGTLGIIGGISAFVAVLGNALRVMMDFSKASSNLQAIMGLTKEEMKALTDQAKYLGSTTAFTASEVIKLQTELAKLGFAKSEILNSTEAVLALAAATGSELAPAAELAGATLRIFNLDATEMTRVSDVLAKSTTVSSLSMEKLETILPIVGKTADIAGVSLERTAALAGTLTDRGLDASSAATSLRNIFQELSKQGLTWEEAMQKINSSTDKNKTAMNLFGKRAAAAGVILAETKTSTDELTAALENSAGAAREMADVMLDNLSGDITIAQSAWEGFILSLTDGEGVFSKALRSMVQGFTDLLSSLTFFNETNWSNRLKMLANLFMDFTEKAFFPIIAAIEYITGKKFTFRFKIDKSAKKDVDELNKKTDKTVKTEKQLQKEREKAAASAKKDVDELNKKTDKTVKTEKQLQKEREKAAAAAKKQSEAIKKAREEEAKANQRLSDQIKQMNVELIQDDYERSLAEIELWNEKEKQKIESSKASAETKNAALEALEALHQKKMLDLRIAKEAQVSAMLEEQMQKEIEAKQKAEEEAKAKEEKDKEDLESFENEKYKVREFYGLVKTSEMRAKALAELEKQRADGLISDKDYAIAKFKINSYFAGKWVEEYSGYMNALSDLFQSQKQAELEAAGDNEEAKKAIMKKYADKEFAVKIAQIIASTSQAIMQAFAQLGPIGGAVAAAMLGAKGLIEVGRANTERRRIKGLAEGGFVTREQDNRTFYAEHGGNKTGMIDKPTVLVAEEGPEFVVSNKALHIPEVRNMVDIIDSFQRNGKIPYFNYPKILNRNAKTIKGYADGGYTETNTAQAEDISIDLINEVKALRNDINNWQTNLKTYVVYEEIEDAGNEINSIKTEVTL